MDKKVTKKQKYLVFGLVALVILIISLSENSDNKKSIETIFESSPRVETMTNSNYLKTKRIVSEIESLGYPLLKETESNGGYVYTHTDPQDRYGFSLVTSTNGVKIDIVNIVISYSNDKNFNKKIGAMTTQILKVIDPSIKTDWLDLFKQHFEGGDSVKKYDYVTVSALTIGENMALSILANNSL